MKGKSKQSLLLGVILLIMATVSLLYWGQQKQVWFCDEIYTYESANGFEQDWPANDKARWMSGSDVEAFFSADWEKLSFDMISARLYCDHVPLFFWLFRIMSFFFFKGSGSIWIGLIMNLVFYLFFVGVVYWLFCKMTKSPFIAAVFVFLTCIVNCLMIEQITMLRMYMMLLLAQGLLLLGGFWVLKNVHTPKIKAGTYLFLFLVSWFGLLTHYHYWVFYAVTAALFCMWLLVLAWRKDKKAFWKSREFHLVLAWVGNFVAALLATFWVFPYAKWNLNRGKGEVALHSIFDFSAKKLELIRWSYQRLSASILGSNIPVVIGLLVIFGCIAGGAFVLYKRKETQKLTGLVLTVLIAQAYQFIVSFTMPAIEEERYLWGSFTLMLFCAVWGAILLLQTLFNRVKGNKAKRSGVLVITMAAAVLFFLVECSVIDGGNGVAYLFHPQKDVTLLEENADKPWVVYGPTVGVYSYYDWLMPQRICFLSEEQTPEDAEAVKELKEQESFVLYTYEGYYEEVIEFFERELEKEILCEKLTKSTNLTVYLVRENK